MNLRRMLSGFVVGGAIVAAIASCLEAASPVPTESNLAELIDREVERTQQTAGVAPAPVTNDENVVRRLTLDLVGRIPAVAEVEEYVRSSHPARRELLVDRLMASTEFSDYMSRRFDWFISGGEGPIQEYLKTAFQENRGWDQMFRDIILADLGTNESALPYLKARVKDTERLTNEVSVTFFGVNISCAKCHDHPLVPTWTQDHFYGMKSFFDRMFDNGGFVTERDFGSVKFTTTAGDERQANLMFLSGRDVTPPDIAGPDEDEKKRLRNLYRELKEKKEPPPPPKSSLRQRLVEVALADGENHFFAKSIVNRVWHQLIGHGLVMPLDQMHSENPGSHPELLDRLAADLREHSYDLRRTIRAIAMSDTYLRGSRWETANRPAPEVFAVAPLRPLTPTQLARSLSLATADQSCFAAACRQEVSEQVAAMADPRHADKFDQPIDGFRVTAAEALLFSNDSEIEETYLNGELTAQLGDLGDEQQVVAEAVWAILSRPTEPEESQILIDYLRERKDRPEQAIQQLVWALLTSSEFRFNH